jgi:hypothetical protein
MLYYIRDVRGVGSGLNRAFNDRSMKLGMLFGTVIGSIFLIVLLMIEA